VLAPAKVSLPVPSLVTVWAAVAGALATASVEGRVGSVQLERIDGEPAPGTAIADAFIAAGFVAGPRRLALRARR